MRNVDYDAWSEYLVSILKPHISLTQKKDREQSTIRVLELAAGEGSLAECMIKRLNIINKNTDYFVSDLSANMIKRCNRSFNRLCFDMRDIPIKENSTFDIIIMAFDSINYLLTQKDLQKMFNEVSKIMKIDGVFTFDVSLETNSLEICHPFTSEISIKGLTYKHKSDYNSFTRIHTNTFIITDLDGNKKKEIHKQKVFYFEDYFKVIEKTDLYVSECYDFFTQKEPNIKSKRIQFIVRKQQPNNASAKKRR